VLAFSAFWAFQIFLAKLGFKAGALVLPFQVMMVAVAILTVLSLLLRRSGQSLINLFQQKPRLFWNLFLANAIQAGLGTFLSIIGIAMTDAINAGFLVKMATVSTIIFAWLILGERLSKLKVGVVFVMLFGAYLLTTKGQALLPHVGDAYILAACVCWSLGNILVKKALKTQSTNADVVTMQKPLASFLFFSTILGVSIFFPNILGGLRETLRPYPFAVAAIPFALGSGISLGLAWIFLYRTLDVATASYMTLMSMATPIMVSLLAMAFLGESLVLIQGAGAGLIILSAGVIYVSDIAYQ
jgi:drug/metabolite transporter (DMT)-like permease